jgi:hypothetical protein
MVLPRRCHRRLLLPPGWLALGFLLLLGCWALLTHRRQILPKNILQLSMPPLKSNGVKESISICGDTTKSFYFSYAGLQAQATAEVNGRWHDLVLRGNPTDSLKLLDAVAAIRAMKADTSHAGGMRIHFYPGVAYRNLVCLVDSVNNLRLRFFWLDIRLSPAVFYAIVPAPMTLAERRCYKENECQGMSMGAITHIVEPPITLGEQFENLRQPERRPLLSVTVGSLVLLLSASAAQVLWANPIRRAPF